MMAVYLTMKHFRPNLYNKNVLIQTDNTTVVQYLNHQGRTKSVELCLLTWNLWSLALENNGNIHCGPLEQAINQTDGMVSEQSSCEQNFSALGSPTDGSVCDISEQENSAVLFMDDSSASFCHRCNVNFLAEHVCLCIPTNTNDFQGVAAYETVSVQDNFDCTELAETVLVSTASENVDSISGDADTQAESIVPGKGSDFTSRSPVSKTDGMAAVDRHFFTKGFSERTRKLLASSWRKGTKKTTIQNLNSSTAGVLNGMLIPFLHL